MKAYFINLDRSPDRREYMTRTLDGLGIAYERIAAVDGRDLADAVIARHYRRPPDAKPLDRGTIACFLSHRQAWRRIADAEDTFGLVLEDDILFGEDASAILADPFWIPADAQVVRLETVRRHTIHRLAPVARVRGRNVVKLTYVQLGGGAYILSRSAAEILFRRTEHFGYPNDFVLSDPQCPEFCGFDILQMTPALCIQSTLVAGPAQAVVLPSMLQQSRKTMFDRGLPRLAQKAAREVRKTKLILSGFLFDRRRGQKTIRIPFR